MSTHNIGFYEDLTKINFELSSNIIEYAPYLFCCKFRSLSTVKKYSISKHYSSKATLICSIQIHTVFITE